MNPQIRYAKSGDVHVAYVTAGKGPVDVIVAPGWLSNVGLIWDNPLIANYYERIASFSRMITFDKRGTGLSDKPGRMPNLEERMDDLRAVMEAAESECAVVFGVSEGGSLSMLFAATYPEKTRGLALYGTFAKRSWCPEYPWAPTPEQRQVFYDAIQNHWHEDMDLENIAPSIAKDPDQVRFLAHAMRLSASPSAALELARMNTEIDVRDILCCINVPTVVMHRTEDRDANVEEGRWIASQIANARFVELPGEDHLPFAGDSGPVLDVLEEFVTGSKSAQVDRILSTVLITDIVGSTRLASEVGDRRWRSLIESHNTLASKSLERHRGRLIKFTGDGLLATFDGPGRAIKCAHDLSELMGQLGLKVRAGIHTGEIELIGQDVGGISVHIASRIADYAGPGEVLTSQTVKDLASGSGVSFEAVGSRRLEGVPGEWPVYTARSL